MNATPPEASTEYSRGSEASSGAQPASGGGLLASLVLAGGALGGLLLLVAEFATLFEVRRPTNTAVVRTVSSGSHHTYALVPIALLVGFLAFGVWRVHSRPALLGIGLLSVVALLISLLGDLPDAHSTGLLRNAAGQFVPVDSSPGAGFYLESLGGAALLITSVGGFLLARPPPPSSSSSSSSSRRRSRASRRLTARAADAEDRDRDRHGIGTNGS